MSVARALARSVFGEPSSEGFGRRARAGSRALRSARGRAASLPWRASFEAAWRRRGRRS